MPADILSDAEAQAWAAFKSRPAMTRALIALCMQGILALPLAMLLGPAVAAAAAGTAATFFLLGRQVEQAAPHWRPGLRLRVTWAAAQQAGYPAVATICATLVAAMLAGGA